MTSLDYCEQRELGVGDGETTVKDSKGALKGVLLISDGSNDATVACYDGTKAAGTKILEAQVAAADLSRPFMLPGRGKKFGSLNVEVTGTGASAHVYYGY